MSAWRRHLLKQFPEFGSRPEKWDLVQVTVELGPWLERAAREGDVEAGRRILAYLLWLDKESRGDERFIYQCQDILRFTVANPDLRDYLASILNERSFFQVAGYIEYLTSKEVRAEIGIAIRRKKHA